MTLFQDSLGTFAADVYWDIEKVPVSKLENAVTGLRDFILAVPILQLALSEGGLIAGGWPRNIVRHKCVNPHHFINEVITADTGRYGRPKIKQVNFGPGDIDIFFITHKDKDNFLKKVINELNVHTTLSTAKLAINIAVPLSSNAGLILSNAVKQQLDLKTDYLLDKIKIQCIYNGADSYEKVLGQFDFINAMIGFTKTHLYSGVDRPKYENKRILFYNSKLPVSPFLGYRVRKYIKKYGYTLADETQTALRDFTVSLICNDFPDYQKLYHHLKQLESGSSLSWSSPNLAARKRWMRYILDIAPDSIIILLLGQMLVRHTHNYEGVDVQDAVVNELNKRAMLKGS